MSKDYNFIRRIMNDLEEECVSIHERIEFIRQQYCGHPEYIITDGILGEELSYPSRVCRDCDQPLRGITKEEFDEFNKHNAKGYEW